MKSLSKHIIVKPAILLLFVLLFGGGISSYGQTIIPVTSNADAGTGTLREALSTAVTAAGTSGDHVLIQFNVSTSPSLCQLTTFLPAISISNGSITFAKHSSALLEQGIEYAGTDLDGAFTQGLSISNNTNTPVTIQSLTYSIRITGLVFRGFSDRGLSTSASGVQRRAIQLTGTENVLIDGCSFYDFNDAIFSTDQTTGLVVDDNEFYIREETVGNSCHAFIGEGETSGPVIVSTIYLVNNIVQLDPMNPFVMPTIFTIETSGWAGGFQYVMADNNNDQVVVQSNQFQGILVALNLHNFNVNTSATTCTIDDNTFSNCYIGVELSGPKPHWIFTINIFTGNIFNNLFLKSDVTDGTQSGFRMIETNSLTLTPFNQGNNMSSGFAGAYSILVDGQFDLEVQLIGLDLDGRITLGDAVQANTHTVIRQTKIRHHVPGSPIPIQHIYSDNNGGINSPILFLASSANGNIVKPVIQSSVVTSGSPNDQLAVNFTLDALLSNSNEPFVADFYKSNDNGDLLDYLGKFDIPSPLTGGTYSASIPIVSGILNLGPGNDRLAVAVTSLSTLTTTGIGTSEVTYDRCDYQVSVVPTPKVGCAGTSVSFIPSHGGTATGYFWDFGDGATSTIQNPTHIYNTGGGYDVAVTIDFSDGCQVSHLSSDAVTIVGLDATFTVDNNTAVTGQTLTFTFTGNAEFSLEFTLDFGDGSPPVTGVTLSPGDIFTHVYSSIGTFNAILTIDNAIACGSDTHTETITVGASITCPTLSIINVQNVTCNGGSDGSAEVFVGGGTSPFTYSWSNGESTAIATGLTAGTYTVVVSDAASCNETAQVTITEPVALDATFTKSTPVIPTGQTVTFTFTGNADFMENFTFDFGDGSTPVTGNTLTSGTTFTHAYSVSGNYSPSLTLNNVSNGCSDTHTETIIVINITCPTVSFTNNPIACVGDPVSFTAVINGGSPPAPVNYTWDFGDGSVVTVQTPTVTHTYLNGATPTITLIVLFDDGCDPFHIGQALTIIEMDASFTTSSTNVTTGQQVTVTYTGAGSPNNTYSFDSGGGFTESGGVLASGHQFNFSYATPGTYTVTLTVQDANGCQDTQTQTITVGAVACPNINFFPVNNTICLGGPAIFSSIIGITNANPVNYSWDFGDGSNLAGPHPQTSSVSHAYSAVGAYDVTLTITLDDGCTPSITKTNIINVIDFNSVSIFTVSSTNVSTTDNVVFTFTGDGSDANDFTLDFGDGTTPVTGSTIINGDVFNHTYTTPGTYTASLTLQSIGGGVVNCTDVFTISITVLSNADLCAEINTALAGNGPLTVTPSFTDNGCGSFDFDATITDLSSLAGTFNLTTIFDWDFGDGIQGSGLPVSHDYTTSGSFVVILTMTITDPGFLNSCVIAETLSVSVVVPPDAAFTATQAGCGGATVNFSLDAGINSTFTYQWDFGDANSSTDSEPQHTYGIDDATFPVTLTVTDPATGCVTTNTVDVDLSVIPGIYFSADVNCANTTVDFTGLASWANTFEWNFGDHDPSSNTITSSSVTDQTHTYAQPGVYRVTFTAYDAVGCTLSTFRYIYAGTPAVSFTANDVCLGQTTAFASFPSNADNYSWDFGDGNNSNLENPVHLYTTAGTFSVTLTVTFGLCTNSYTKDVDVQDGINVQASFLVNNFICEGDDAIFDNTSTGGADYIWDFGDGSAVSNDEDPVHTYPDPGNYEVTLNVSIGSCGETATDHIVVKPDPVVTIQAPSTDICEGQSVTLTANIDNFNFTETYTYTWTDANSNVLGTQSTLTVAESGDYTATVDNGCGTNSSTITITVHPLPEIETINVDKGISCFGSNDGQATIAFLLGDDPNDFNMAWVFPSQHSGQGMVGATASDLHDGGLNYVIITELLTGCAITRSVPIPYDGPVVTTVVQNAFCNGTPGNITATVTGGTSPYEFLWSDPNAQTDAIATGLAAGNYDLSVIDNKSCTVILQNIFVGTPVVTLSVNNLQSCGSDPVEVSAIANFFGNGETPSASYTYNWYSDDGTTLTLLAGPVTANAGVPVTLNLADNPTSENYEIQVTDNDYGCTAAQPFVVTEAPPVEITLNATDVSCFGGSDGKIIAQAGGGTGGLTYEWNDGGGVFSNSGVVDNLPIGTYSVTVTDTRGCSATDNVTLTEPDVLFVEINMGTTCNNTSVNAFGGTPPYTFHWIRTRNSQGDDIPDNTELTTTSTTVTAPSPLIPGFYVVEMVDANGCTKLSVEEEIGGRTNSRLWTVQYVWRHPGDCLNCDSPPPPTDETEEVVKDVVQEAINDANGALQRCLDDKAQEMNADVGLTCFSREQFSDNLQLSYNLPYYHYTLYYYDRAGELVQTVPPEGVEPLLSTEINDVVDFRADNGGTAHLNNHGFKTKYEYNNLTKLKQQETPNGGISRFIYNDEVLLRFSQNARQAGDNTFSYTKYDDLSRIIEVGESHFAGGSNFTTLENAAIFNNPDFPAPGTHLEVTANSEVTKMVYTVPSNALYQGEAQAFLRNRISHALLDHDGDFNTINDQALTHYSYDPHGNVQWLLQDVPGFKRTSLEYDYDLISSNVKNVFFNQGLKDRFYHRYGYDGDNRIADVETSLNSYIWDKDGRYDYYLRGPLKRTEIGEDKIQGTDNMYTIHGWLKAINHPELNPAKDPGGDGSNDFLSDVFGMALSYYRDVANNIFDFKRTNTDIHTLNDYTAITDNLFNGNISSWTSQIDQSNLMASTDPYIGEMTGRKFGYDQLNRIKSSDFAHFNGTWNTTTDFHTDYTYDANGNILALNRNAHNSSILSDNAMDALSYSYSGTNNRLQSVTDNLSGVQLDGKLNDIMGTHTYTYDAIGNLTGETYDEILFNPALSADGIYTTNTTIDWTMYGKVREVNKVQTPTNPAVGDPIETQIRFKYDALGNRVVKEVTDPSANDPVVTITTTYYVRDASGNIMAIYERTNEKIAAPIYRAIFKLKELPIYGSDRIGQVSDPLGGDPIAEINFNINDGLEVSFDDAGLQAGGEYLTWISPANKEVVTDVDNDTKECDCEVQQVNFDLGVFLNTGVAGKFMGEVGNNVTVAEDVNGVLQFYALTAKTYLGNQNVCLVFDAQGDLMEGSSGIISEPSAKALVMKKPGNNKQYYLFTIGTDLRPSVQTIDMNQAGFGISVDKRGEVISKNVQLTDVANHDFNFHMTAIEDGFAGKHRLYLARYNDPQTQGDLGTVEIVVYEYDDNTTNPAPVVVTTLDSKAEEGDGELQLSKNGSQLLYYNKKKHIGGFAHRQIEVTVMILGADGKSIVDVETKIIEGDEAGTFGKASADFAHEEDVVYFNQQGVYKKEPITSQFTEKNILKHDPTLSPNPTETLAGTLEYGEVRRAQDGRIFVPGKNNENEFTTILPDGTVQTEALANAGQGYKLAGSFPTQVIKLIPADAATDIFSRFVGRKQYEIKDHLSNVRVVVNDRRGAGDISGGAIVNFAIVDAFNNYYPFGMEQPTRIYNSPDYRYGFNGKEKDDEIKGTGKSYDFGARIYDPRLGRFASTDPWEGKYSWQTPYAYFKNRPVSQIDWNGFGDYYDKDGKHLGSDGKTKTVGEGDDAKEVPDDKVYTADAVTTDAAGNKTFSNAVDLGVTHTQFATTANVVAHESSGDKTEGLWIAHTANNAKDNNAIDWRRKNTTLYDQLTDQNYSTTPASARTPLSTASGTNSANNARAAVIDVLTGGADPTGGSVLWDGYDFLKYGSAQNKFKEYTKITISADIMWKYAMGPRRSSKTFLAGTFVPALIKREGFSSKGTGKYFSLRATGAPGIGESIFWKLEPK
ncbi:MAG: hypothetical protein COA57_00120 [Flavobacteriales bacterium]|nr:MAG: hypothetical protein COA57_00120 [Flavobacteriales bacterium]